VNEVFAQGSLRWAVGGRFATSTKSQTATSEADIRTLAAKARLIHPVEWDADLAAFQHILDVAVF
jgi:hypothetical protein